MIRRTLATLLVAALLGAPTLLSVGCTPEEAADSIMEPNAAVASSTVDSLNENIEERTGDYSD